MASKGPDRPRQPRGEQTGGELDRRLDQVDQVSASVFEENGDNGTYVFWFAAKDDPESFEAAVLGMDVGGDEGSGRNARGEKCFLIGLSWRETHGFEDKFDTFGAFGCGNGQPAEFRTHGNVLVFYEA